MSDFILFFILAPLIVAVFFVPLKAKFYLSLLLTSALIGISSFYAVGVLRTGNEIIFSLPLNLIWGKSLIVIDAISAFFILVINFTVFTGLLYSKGYLQPYIEIKTRQQISLHYFSYLLLYISMILVSIVRDGFSFLFVWELMTVSSFLLVIFDSEKEGVLKTGINYLIQMHVGFLFILSAFIVADIYTGTPGFEGVTLFFKEHNNIPVFILFFIGFGIKAGFIPLHTWLPHAHPAAPSHVSGVMSGVMIKMGIYGILRVSLSLQEDVFTIGVFLLIISAISGIFGVMLAIVQHDLKKLLAYHSIENIGIIGMGIGLGLIGKATGNVSLAVLGFTGGILHILNHSLFKSLLFYCAGSVYQQCRTKNINNLGGLIKKMPYTAILFLLASLSICGLPPFNGFVSEFLIYSSLFKNIADSGFYMSLLILGSIIALSVIGGLAIFCFTKAFGITFLGSERTPYTSSASEVSKGMLLPKILTTVIILAIGFVPLIFTRPIMKLASVALNLPFETQAISIDQTLLNVSIAGGVFVVIVTVLLVYRKYSQSRFLVEHGPTWGCGYTGADPAIHQYTATSFADNYKVLAKPLLGVETHYTPFAEKEIFPAENKFESHSYDLVERNLVEKPVTKFMTFIKSLAVMQTGSVHHYLVYPIIFIVLIFILTLLNLI